MQDELAGPMKENAKAWKFSIRNVQTCTLQQGGLSTTNKTGRQVLFLAVTTIQVLVMIFATAGGE
jgi:hypothetical protein